MKYNHSPVMPTPPAPPRKRELLYAVVALVLAVVYCMGTL